MKYGAGFFFSYRDLREKVEEEKGDGFEVREFHRNLLPCHGPLDTLERCYRYGVKQNS